MKRILAVTMIVLGGLALISCGDASVTPKNTTAAPTNAATNNAPPATSANAEADVKKLVKDVETALSKNDVDALDKIYAPDYSLVNTDGSMQTRAERLASIKSGDTKYESFSYSDVTVTPYGDTAVVRAIATIKGMNKGKPIDGKLRVTTVWVKGKDGWKQVSGQATPITEAAKTDDTKKDDMKKDDMKKDDDKK
ncbi:MAG TPA: nuclear transport factor 2 family protein [Pyrinomonadaceae bacterium]|jgi:ketosteroid isomerase-like protein|nr:nuclear transport factor 2 family protein [Pyrinomonadaceae bacterium]